MNIWMVTDKLGYTEVYVVPTFNFFTMRVAMHPVLVADNIKRTGVTGPDSAQMCLWREFQL